MAVAGLLGTVLGPSPLLLPFAPLISVAYAPFAIATSALGMPAGLANLGVGGKAAFILWCTLLSAAEREATLRHDGCNEELRPPTLKSP